MFAFSPFYIPFFYSYDLFTYIFKYKIDNNIQVKDYRGV